MFFSWSIDVICLLLSACLGTKRSRASNFRSLNSKRVSTSISSSPCQVDIPVSTKESSLNPNSVFNFTESDWSSWGEVTASTLRFPTTSTRSCGMPISIHLERCLSEVVRISSPLGKSKLRAIGDECSRLNVRSESRALMTRAGMPRRLA